MTTVERVRTAFAYEAQTADGQRFQGTLEAASVGEVQAKLGALQLTVLTVQPAEAGPRPRSRGLDADEFVIFNQQLAHLTQAGLPVERGLRLIAIDLRSGKLAAAAEAVAAELERGVPLKDAFSKHAGQFPALYGKLVEAGASAGNLPGMLFNMGRHLELVGRLRKSLWQTLAYPIMVLVGLSLVLLLISVAVLPHFEEVYKQFKLTPPFITQVMLGLGRVYPWVFGVGAAIVLLLALATFARRIGGREAIAWESFFRAFPFIGGILRASLLARWIDALRLSVEAGMDLPRAIDLAAEATGSPQLSREAGVLARIVQEGQPLSSYQGRLIPSTIPAAMELASNAGDLNMALLTLSRMYEQQAEHRLRLLPSFLSPLTMMVVMIAIVLCLGALFAPLLQYIKYLSSDSMF